MQGSGDSDSTVVNVPSPFRKKPEWHNRHGMLDHRAARSWSNGWQIEQLGQLDGVVVQTENTR